MDAGLEDILDGYFPFWGCIHKASFRFSPWRLGEYLDCILWFLSFKGWDHVCFRTVTQRSVLFVSKVALSKSYQHLLTNLISCSRENLNETEAFTIVWAKWFHYLCFPTCFSVLPQILRNKAFQISNNFSHIHTTEWKAAQLTFATSNNIHLLSKK